MRTTHQVIPFARSTNDPAGSEARAMAPYEARAMQSEAENRGAPAYVCAYLEWKHWRPENFGVLSTQENADFAALLRKAKVDLPDGSRVLEIGFGNGTFLQFGRQRRWKMHGTEVNRGLLDCAWETGFPVTETDTLEPFPSQAFEMVAAFDVMEHIPLEALPGFLSEVRRVLKPDGVFVARFPNGDSPFGRHIQNGDVTHRTARVRGAGHLGRADAHAAPAVCSAGEEADECVSEPGVQPARSTALLLAESASRAAETDSVTGPLLTSV